MADASVAVSRKPFFSISLTPQEIEEDLALIISSTKRDGRKRKRSLVTANGGGAKPETGSSGSNPENQKSQF